MLMRLKHTSRWTILMVYSLMLVPLLIACGAGGSSGSGAAFLNGVNKTMNHHLETDEVTYDLAFLLLE